MGTFATVTVKVLIAALIINWLTPVVKTQVPEPEVEGEPEGEVEPKPEGEGEPTAETEPEGEGSFPKTKINFPEDTPDVAPEERPPAEAITVPPFSLVFLILAGIVFLAWKAKSKKTDDFTKKLKSHFEMFHEAGTKTDEQPDKNLHFYTELETDMMSDLRSFYNQPIPLLKVALPALTSLSFCPAVLYMYKPFVDFFWPYNKENGIPMINDSIACFLAPAGFIYALTFAFCFQSAMGKQSGLLRIISQEVALLDQIVILTSYLNIPISTKAKVYRALKADVFSIGLQIQGKRGYSSQDYIGKEASGQTWTVLKNLEKEVNPQGYDWCTDIVMFEKILTLLAELNLASSERIETQEAKIHPLKWIFLEVLGFFSFFGILLLRTYSDKLDLTICILTVFAITSLCYVICDMDSPFSGFLRVDVTGLAEMLEKTRYMYETACDGFDIKLPTEEAEIGT